jgi:hypothetical protein
MTNIFVQAEGQKAKAKANANAGVLRSAQNDRHFFCNSQQYFCSAQNDKHFCSVGMWRGLLIGCRGAFRCAVICRVNAKGFLSVNPANTRNSKQ